MLKQHYKLFGTWKDRLTRAQSIDLAQEIRIYTRSLQLPFELSLCPPMVTLHAVSREITDSTITLTAQNMIWDDKLSFTGETKAEVLNEIGCKNVILGHSERRLHLGETDEMVARKVASAVRHGLVPVICIGESFEDYQNGLGDQVVEKQTHSVLVALSALSQPPEFIIAYEPAWAISTSRQALKCEPSYANERHRQIRDIIRQLDWGKDFETGIPIIYGGSITPQNATDYFGESDIDGGLVGSASQTKESFIELIKVAYASFEKKSS